MKHFSTIFLAVMGVGLIMAGCVKTPQTADITGSWEVTKVDGVDVPGTVVVTMNLEEDRVSGSSGCNRYSGGYSMSGNNLTFGPAAMTRMACPPPGMETEVRFGRALDEVTRFDLSSGGDLLLFADDNLLIQAARK
ncbi:META domain-containing protein [Pseudorhodobacter aquimaris]|uniref:META domain-containing protein n=1 Tax=Pseudorhodobacter aquimaris TaxID=687412 RepID=UPI00067BC55A|nr:META domain-containing protein [Pseudorhodobacter aquimaris]